MLSWQFLYLHCDDEEQPLIPLILPLKHCILQANAINERIGYPEFILNETELDSLYQGVSVQFLYVVGISF